jgi:hypothetical protein
MDSASLNNGYADNDSGPGAAGENAEDSQHAFIGPNPSEVASEVADNDAITDSARLTPNNGDAGDDGGSGAAGENAVDAIDNDTAAIDNKGDNQDGFIGTTPFDFASNVADNDATTDSASLNNGDADDDGLALKIAGTASLGPTPLTSPARWLVAMRS